MLAEDIGVWEALRPAYFRLRNGSTGDPFWGSFLASLGSPPCRYLGPTFRFVNASGAHLGLPSALLEKRAPLQPQPLFLAFVPPRRSQDAPKTLPNHLPFWVLFRHRLRDAFSTHWGVSRCASRGHRGTPVGVRNPLRNVSHVRNL